MKRWHMLGLLCWLVPVLALSLSTPTAEALPLKAVRARLKILALELDEAGDILSGDDDAADVAIERGRLALYRGDCDGAVANLSRPDLEEDEMGGALLQIAMGCARGTAATVVLRDDAKGVVVRFQDDDDVAMFPLIVEATVKARDNLAEELGTRLPSPVWIDLVRDQLTLSALSGLPERAAQTTGTVAVAKWGRVMMISPRAARGGYPWLDTLTHELTHLVLSQATLDRAPLWLQEGVAKRQETRWRERGPFDAQPSADAVALDGMKRGLALPLTELGPSIAMLPTAEQAAIAFAEVSSFINYWIDQNGKQALPKLLTAIRDAPPNDDVSKAIEEVSGHSLAVWDKRWRAHLGSRTAELSQEINGNAPIIDGAKFARRRRLGQLLLGRQHHNAAHHQLSLANKVIARETSVRCMLADAHAGLGERLEASSLVSEPKDIDHASGRWWSLHQSYLGLYAFPQARWRALAHDPLNPAVACHELDEGEYPSDPVHRALCLAAWRVPQP